jgi:membrane protease YdiL (CAAX protease family)
MSVEDVTESVQSRVGGWISGLDPIRVGSTWVLFLLALPFLEGQAVGLEALVGGGLVGLPLVVLGYLAASGCRAVPERDMARRAKLAIVTLVVGIGVGAANLGVNVALATADGSIRALLQEHFAEPMPWARVASVAVVEEIASRLFVMSVVAWIVARFVNKDHTVFLTALIVSAFLFAVPHLLGRPMPTSSAFATLYASGVVVKSGLAGLVLGWIFWRWGLPYAMVCHFAANGLHTVFEPMLFS